jgi:acyl-coenzyme A thioesterase PaaI-like protein
MRESLQSRCFRWLFNWWPCYRGTGGRVTFIAHDWRTLRVKLPLNLRTRNYVGTIFGGSLYAAVDPFCMLMLIKNLGPDYVVWDKAASIRFRKPGRSTLTAEFKLDGEEVEAIREALESVPKVDRVYTITLVDAQGEAHAVIEKVVHVSRREP